MDPNAAGNLGPPNPGNLQQLKDRMYQIHAAYKQELEQYNKEKEKVVDGKITMQLQQIYKSLQLKRAEIQNLQKQLGILPPNPQNQSQQQGQNQGPQLGQSQRPPPTQQMNRSPAPNVRPGMTGMPGVPMSSPMPGMPMNSAVPGMPGMSGNAGMQGPKRPPLASSQPAASRDSSPQPTSFTTAATTDSSSTKILSKRKIQELVSQIDPREKIDPDVEEALLEIADDFIESLTNFGCMLAKHRKSDTLEAKDIQLHLEKNWSIRIPGFGSDEIKPIKKTAMTDAHKQRLALLKKAETQKGGQKEGSKKH